MRLGALLLGFCAILLPTALVPAQSATAQAAANFRPVSSTWLNPQTGYVLGSTPCGQDEPCPRLLTTTDGGRHWHRRTAPDVAVENGNPPTITAAGDGTLFVDRYVDHVGKLLRSTDGGRTWHRIEVATPKGQQVAWVDRILLDHGEVYALLSTAGSEGVDRAAVYTMRKSQHRLTPRRDLSVQAEMPYGDISNRGGVLQIMLGSYGEDSRYWYAFGPERHLRRAPEPCSADQEVILGGVTDGHPVAGCVGPAGTPQPGHAPKQLAAAGELGARFATVGNSAPTAGAPEGFAQPTRTHATFAATGGGLVFVYATTDAGRHWKAVFSEPGFAPKDLSFVSSSVGTFVHLGAEAQQNRLYRTTNGGATWSKINFAG